MKKRTPPRYKYDDSRAYRTKAYYCKNKLNCKNNGCFPQSCPDWSYTQNPELMEVQAEQAFKELGGTIQ